MTLAVVFDLDDTLYPEQSYNFSGFAAVGEYLLLEHGVTGFAIACEEMFRAGIRGDIFNQVAGNMGVNLPIAELVEVYRMHTPRIELFDDARWILDRARGRFPLGLITDGFAPVQRRKVRALGIEPAFDSIVYSDDFGRAAWKPSDVPYRKTMDKLAGTANRFVYIADNPAKDFVTARALGWHTMMVDRPTIVRPRGELAAEQCADHTITSLRDIPWHRLGESR